MEETSIGLVVGIVVAIAAVGTIGVILRGRLAAPGSRRDRHPGDSGSSAATGGSDAGGHPGGSDGASDGGSAGDGGGGGGGE